jgi:hypothetical protein
VKLLTIFSIVCCATILSAQDGASWLRPAPLDPAIRSRPIPRAYEVVASKVDSALQELEKEPIVALTPTQAKHFTGAYFTSAPGTRPYLVRAVYGHGATGNFHVNRLGERAVFVGHFSLGPPTDGLKSALVVNLDFDPLTLYVELAFSQ